MSIFSAIRRRKQQLDRLGEYRRAQRAANAPIKLKPRIFEVLDKQGVKRLFDNIPNNDPLDFPGYADKIGTLQKRTKRPDAFICARGNIEGRPVVCCELVPEFLMGSMGTALGEAVTRSAEYALEQRIPLIIFSASGGARMQEGMFSLMQMAKTSAAIRRLEDAGILYISVLTHPTTGGVTASFASLGGIILAEPGALIGFAGPRVIEQTIRAKLPEGFQRAEFQQEHGFVDAIIERKDLRVTLSKILRLHDSRRGDFNRPPCHPARQRDVHFVARTEIATKPSKTSHRSRSDTVCDKVNVPLSCAANTLTPQEHVQIARNQARPHIETFIEGLFSDFFEFRGDRHFADDRALICGLALFDGMPVAVAGHAKGADTNQNLARNFGMPSPEGYRKFQRLLAHAERHGLPVITFIDTPGAYPGTGAEERGQGDAIARCLATLSGLATPIVAVVTGEGGSGGALALGLADTILMYEYATYAVLSPEGFASILWKDATRAPEAAGVMKLAAADLLAAGMVDTIIAEPAGGAHNDPAAAVAALHDPLRAALCGLAGTARDVLIGNRYNRFRRY
jgi:acetyl-CoA carboxylase carboxyl transferase subunit beta